MPRKLGDSRSCGRVICLHLVQEFNVGPVDWSENFTGLFVTAFSHWLFCIPRHEVLKVWFSH